MTRSIMLQGTASGVGKSVVATGLCRLLREEGYRVAPFKAWNMSLNSYVTPSGGEVGRSQAVQARAAGIEIREEMQPLLIKPSGGGKTQVIVRGKPLGTFGSDRKKEDYVQWAMGVIRESLGQLADEYQLLVMEGAGSPAEINIRDQDLANMKVAMIKRTPVILVADMKAGGAFSYLMGTIKLFSSQERQLVRGIILNRFQGALKELEPEIDMIEEKTGVPVLGVIPYLSHLKLPEEDSLSLSQQSKEGELLRIGVIRLPHLSNFTDFDRLSEEAFVGLSYLGPEADLSLYDALILPGTKNTSSDLMYLWEEGLAEQLIHLAERGREIIGVCGGYQMLGSRLLDPQLTEGNQKVLPGLGLLPVETEFSPEKATHRVRVRVKKSCGLWASLTGQELEGYEIHMGDSRLIDESQSLLEISSRSGSKLSLAEGAINRRGNVWGTYLHGLFDNKSLRHQLLNHLFLQRGMPALNEQDFGSCYDEEKSYQELAATLRSSLDLRLLDKILRESEF